VPFNGLAKHERPAALRRRTDLCSSELRHLSHNGELQYRDIQSRRRGICPDRNAYFSESDALRFLPHQQQFLAEFNSLLWMPFGGLAKHDDPWRLGPKSHHNRVSYGLFDLPLHFKLDNIEFQSRDNHLPVDRRPYDGCLYALPCEWQLQRDAAHRLLRLPHGCMAKHDNPWRLGSEPHYFRLSDDLCVLSHDDVMARSGLQPQRDGFPFDRRARDDGLQFMPYQFRRAANRLLQLPHCQLAEHPNDGWSRPGPYRQWLSPFEHVLNLPQHRRMDRRDIHTLVVEGPAPRGHLRQLPSNAGPRHELRVV
jgi:hypothetical protein